MKRYIILDLDGCIADDRRRLRLIDHAAPDPWVEYHRECEQDALINPHVADLGRKFRPFIFTARPESVRAQTERWLRNVARLDVARLFMRPDGCRKPSHVLKGDYLTLVLLAGVKLNQITFAADDREDVLEVYRKKGITTILVQGSEVE